MTTLDPMADVIEQMPEPSDFAAQIQAPGADTLNIGEDTPDDASDFNFDTPGEKSSPSPDSGPEKFDPNIHCVDENGNPKVTKSGKFRRKRGKANAVATPSLTDIDPIRRAKAKQAAQVSVAATFVAGQICFGPEGAPMEGEVQEMDAAYTDFYYLSEKPIDLPPWVLVAMVSANYVAKRLAMEKPRSRVSKGISWLYAKASTAWNYVWHWTV